MLKHAAKRIFTCKNRSRYRRKRATFCRNFANRLELEARLELLRAGELGLLLGRSRHDSVSRKLLRGAEHAAKPVRRRPAENFGKKLGKIAKFCKILQIFGGLVLGCTKTKFCKKICVRQHFSSSTRFASFCTAAIAKISQKIGLKKQQFSWNFS